MFKSCHFDYDKNFLPDWGQKGYRFFTAIDTGILKKPIVDSLSFTVILSP